MQQIFTRTWGFQEAERQGVMMAAVNSKKPYGEDRRAHEFVNAACATISPAQLSFDASPSRRAPRLSQHHVLGVSAFYHDSAACLVRDGEIVAAAQEERFTRIKGDDAFPLHAVEYCLREAGARIDDLDAVVFYDKPLLKFERILETYLGVAPRGFKSFLKAGPLWLKEKLYTDRSIRDSLGGYSGKVLYSEHHESHAASAFFPSPFEEAAILTIDGVGEWATASIGRGTGNSLELIRELHWPDSLGLLYSAFTYHTGFKVNSGEYKVMGLAPYGQPKYVDAIYEHLIDLQEDGSFRLNQRYFNYLSGLTMTSPAFSEIFGGPPRVPESRLTQRDMDLARSIQDVCEEIVLRMSRTAHRETGSGNLCLAGGVALNAVANGRVLRQGPFERVWIQPAAGDAGGALGSALLAWHRYFEAPRTPVANDSMKGSLLGPQYSEADIESELTTAGAVFHRVGVTEVIRKTAELLASEQVVGWFQGRMEFGPRALGARSILADPRSPKMQSLINLKIKFREGFRPFAPSVLENRASDYFELDAESPYMLIVAPVRKERRLQLADSTEQWGIDLLNLPRSDIPAVTHLDYSARIQTVTKHRTPEYFALIAEFERLTGCPLVVNTSFNVRGEPVVCTPTDAYRCFMRTHLDHLAIGPFLLAKSEQPQFDETRGRNPFRWTDMTALPYSASKGRRFAITVAGAFALLAAISRWRGHELPPVVMGALAIVLLLAGLIAPSSLGPVDRAWMALARAISRVTTPVFMGIVYFVVLTPMGLLRRTIGTNPLVHRAERRSHWIARPRAEPRKARMKMERQF